MEFEPVIGLEVHVELSTRTKLFCSCPNRFGDPPNSLVCPVCLGLPGTLPVVNRRAVEWLLRVALATGCRVPEFSRFDRKNYFYPDIPKNYQISQYALPLASGGHLEFDSGGEERSVGIARIHLEEDTGKSLHRTLGPGGEPVPGRIGGSDFTLVDYNRAGVPLLEIVSEPELRSPQEAHDFLVALRDLLRWLEVSDCRMEQGSLRCDANVSLRPQGSPELGTKTEIKNMNSFKSVRAALAHEVERQAGLLACGRRVVRETRGWDEDRQVTHPLRTKEEVHDYRYFPDPDLVPLRISREWLERLREGLPELPRPRSRRYQQVFGLSAREAALLVSSRPLSDFFEEAVRRGGEARQVSNWLLNEVSRLLNESGLSLEESHLEPEHLTALLRLTGEGVLSNRGARQVLERVFYEGGDPRALMEKMGLAQISGEEELLQVARGVMEENPVPVQEYRAGKKKAFHVLVGQVMRRTRGRANPGVVTGLLRRLLETEG